MSEADQFPELSPAAEEVLDAWLATRLRADTPEPVSTETLVRYLTGGLPPAQAAKLERALTGSRASRRKLAQALRTLDEIRKLDRSAIGALAARAEGELKAEVAGAWLALVEERAAAAPRLAQLLRTVSWPELRDRATRGAEAAEAALASAALLVERLRYLTSLPRTAAARGAAGGPASGSGFQVVLAEVTADGCLEVTAAASPVQPPAAEWAAAAVLSLVLDGERWRVAEAPVEEGRVCFVVPASAVPPGLPVGRLPDELLAVERAGAPEGGGGTAVRLPLPVRGNDGETVAGAAVGVELIAEPTCDGASLSLLVSVPPETARAFPGTSLRLLLALSPDHRQELGSWSVAALKAAPSRLEVPCPGCPAGRVPLGPSFQLDLLAGPEETGA